MEFVEFMLFVDLEQEVQEQEAKEQGSFSTMLSGLIGGKRKKGRR